MRTFYTILFLVYSFSVFSQKDEKINPLTTEAALTNDFSSNLFGGIKQGSTAMGLINLSLLFNTEDAKLWKGGEFFIHSQNTHGGNLTGDYVGDIQTLSNIENGNYTYLYELYYSQNFEKFKICAGIHDLNSELVNSDYGALYLTSSFGIMPSISMNVPVSIFPHNSLALIVNYFPMDNLLLTGAIYDGNPGSLDNNKYGFDLNLNKGDGYFSIAEFKYSFLKNDFETGYIKYGSYYSSLKYQNFEDSTSQLNGNYGSYFILNYLVRPNVKNVNKGWGIVVQGGICPSKINNFNSHIGVGFNYKGILKNKNDQFGIGITYLSLSKYLQNASTKNHETAIELTYNVEINENFSIQPDFQYILNPGMLKGVENAFVATLRTNISF